MHSFEINILKTDINRNTKSIVENIMTALYGDNTTLPFYNRVLKVFPELNDRINVGQEYDEIWKVVSECVSVRLANEKLQIQSKLLHFKELSDSVLAPAIKELIDIFHVHYENTQNCNCYLGLFNPFPRDVMLREYCIHYNVSDEIFLRSSLHEINHMILFDKWKSMHGYDKSVEPSYPDILWYLEELAIEPTLNDCRIQSILPIRHTAYDSFRQMQIGGKALTEHIQAIYDNSENIESFLDEAYAFIAQNISQIN